MAKNNECIEERESSYRVKLIYRDDEGNKISYSQSFSFKKYGTKQKALEYAKKHRDEIKVKIVSIDKTNGFLRVSLKKVPEEERYNTHENTNRCKVNVSKDDLILLRDALNMLNKEERELIIKRYLDTNDNDEINEFKNDIRYVRLSSSLRPF